MQDGYDAFRGAHPMLVRLLDGPQRAPAAAMLGLYDERGVGGQAFRTSALAYYRMAAEAGYGRNGGGGWGWRTIAAARRPATRRR